VGAVENTESNCGLEEGMCSDAVVVRIELRVADEVTAGVILELDLGSWYDAGADSNARPGGNGRGRGWITTPTLPPGHPRSWFPIVVVFPSPFVYRLSSTALTAPSSIGRNGGGDRNKQRAEGASKNDLADAPSMSNDMSVIICEGL